MSPRSGYGYVADSLQSNKWVFLCANCPRPRTKTDDPDVPALGLNDETGIWRCPVCGFEIADADLYGAEPEEEPEIELEKMTPDEMIAHCKQQQTLQGVPDAMVTFKMPGGARGEARRLFGRSGPEGRVVGTERTTSIVAFKADEVIAALESKSPA